MTIATIVTWVLGTVLAQAAIAMFISKFSRAGRGFRFVEAGMGFGGRQSARSESDPPNAIGKTYTDLSALLIALSPQNSLVNCDLRSELKAVLRALSCEPEGTARGEASAECATVQPSPNRVGLWPAEGPSMPGNFRGLQVIEGRGRQWELASRSLG
jgi:hypothetical protein